ncbi:MAG: transporter substrate-binding domain-containing protein [Lachnospiraceae bacterium]
MKRRDCFLVVLFITLLAGFCLTGCSLGGGQNKEIAQETKEQDFSIDSTGAIKEIQDRGYLIVGCKDDVPGFGYYNQEKKEYEGGEIELSWYLAAKIFDMSLEEVKKQQLVHFEPVKVSDREDMLVENRADYIIATYTITKEREEKVSFSESYYRDSVGMMVLSETKDNNSLSDPKISSIESLDGKRIGIMSGSTTRKEMMEYMERNTLSITPLFMEYPSYDKLNKALAKGDIDVFCVDTCILKGYLDKNRKILPQYFSPQDYGIGASKEKPELIDAANKVLSELNYLKISLF